MNKSLHNKDGHQEDIFSINADQGWQNMAALLDAEMPIKKKRLLWPRVLKTMMAACLLFAVLKTTDNTLKTPTEGGTEVPAATATATDPGLTDIPATAASVASSTSNTTRAGYGPNEMASASGNASSKTVTGNRLFSPANHKENLLLTDKNAGIQDASKNFVSGAQIDKIGLLDPSEATIAEVGKTSAAGDEFVIAAKKINAADKAADSAANEVAQKKSTKNARSKAFDFYAGAQLQQGFHLGNTFTVSPYAQVQLNLGKKMYASVGVGVYTGNGGAKAEEITEELVNDVANNIKNYSTTISHTKLRYIDVPLAVGIKLNKHLSVEAGLQASFLVNSTVNREKVAYDFRMTNLGYVPPVTVQAPLAVIVQPESKPRSTDLRYLAGVRYDIGRITAKLQYQQGFKPVMAPASYNEVHATKAQTVNLQVLYRLWK